MPNEWIPIIVIIVYLAGVTVASIRFSGRNRSGKDWAVAGGGMGLWMVAVGIAGTRIGGAGTYGVAGNVMSGGVWYAWWYGISTFMAMLLVGSLYAIPYRRLRLHTVGEIFQIRFGNTRCQTMTSFCVQTEYLIVNVIEAYVIGIILTSLLGWPMSVTVCIAAVVLISYVSIGGLRAAAVANLIHCVVIVGGLLLVAILGIDKLGGWQQITNSVGAHLANTPDSGPEESTWWAFFGGGSGAIIGIIFSTAIHSPAASVYTNYASSCRTEKMVFPAFLLAGLIAGLMPLLAGLIGIETLAMFGVDRSFDGYKNIAMLATTINPYIGGLALAAILAAVISSGGPILLASATMLVRDWGWFAIDATESGQLRAYRLATVCYGAVAAFLAWSWSQSDAAISILDVLLFGFAMVVPPAIAVGFLIYWRRTTESAAFYGMVAGYVGGLVWSGVIRWAVAVDFVAVDTDAAWRHWFQYFFVHNGKGVDPSYLTTLIPLLVIPALSLLQAPETERSEAFYRRLR